MCVSFLGAFAGVTKEKNKKQMHSKELLSPIHIMSWTQQMLFSTSTSFLNFISLTLPAFFLSHCFSQCPPPIAFWLGLSLQLHGISSANSCRIQNLCSLSSLSSDYASAHRWCGRLLRKTSGRYWACQLLACQDRPGGAQDETYQWGDFHRAKNRLMVVRWQLWLLTVNSLIWAVTCCCIAQSP